MRTKSIKVEERDVDDSSDLKKVLNLYRNASGVKCGQRMVEKDIMDEICSFSGATCSQPAVALTFEDLDKDDREDIREDMSDWEVYMYCKENEERRRARNDKTSLPIRNQYNSNIVIKVKSYQNDLHDTTFFPKDKFEEDREESLQSGDEMNHQNEETGEKYREAKEEKALGNKCYDRKDYEKACQHYTNSLNLFPLPEFYNNRAMTYIKMGNYSAALRDINEVFKRDPDNVKAHYRKAVCRKGMRMYEEALKEIKDNSGRKWCSDLRTEIENEISKLKGKKYLIRPRDGSRKKFQIDVSQLSVYANCDQYYVLEVDKMGCVRCCVCEYCAEEDRRDRNKSDGLRIKERCRWKPLTNQLLKEIGVAAQQVNDFVSHNSHNPAFRTKIKNENVNRSTNETPIKNARPIHLKHTSNRNPSKSENAIKSNYHKDDISTHNNGSSIDRLHYDGGSITEIRSLNNIDAHECDDRTATLAAYLKNADTSSLKKDFGGDLKGDQLAAIVRIIRNKFQLKKEWNRISDILTAVSSMPQFPIIIKQINENTKDSLRSLLDEATASNLQNAAVIKEKYLGLFSKI